MDQTDPDLTFNKHGVCNYCQDAFAKANDRRAERLERPWIIHQAKTNKKYDVLLGLSGGVDSSYTLHCLLESKLRPYTFSLDNDENTPEANHNIKNLVQKTGVDHEVVKIDLGKYHELQKAFVLSGVSNIEIPTDHILMAVTYRMAKKKKIRTVVGGGNWQTESIMPKAWGYEPKDLTHIKAIYKRFIGKRLKGLPTISLPGYIWNRFVRRIKIVNLLDYYDYNRRDAIQTLVERYDFKPYGEKHGESKFTKWFQDYYLPVKFGYDKRKPHLSSMIHSGQITRDEALEELAQPLKTKEKYYSYIKSPNKTYKDYPNSEYWWDLASKLWQRSAVLRRH